MFAQSSLYENKVLFTKPFQGSPCSYQLKYLVFKNEWILGEQLLSISFFDNFKIWNSLFSKIEPLLKIYTVHSTVWANLNKSEFFLRNTITASNYILSIDADSGPMSMYFDAVVLFFKKKNTFIQIGSGHTMVAKPSWISGLYWTFPRFSGKIYCNDLLWWLQLEFYCAWLCEI